MTAPDEDRAPAGGQSATTALPQSMQLDGLALPVGDYRFRGESASALRGLGARGAAQMHGKPHGRGRIADRHPR
jgi:hypothetical protein